MMLKRKCVLGVLKTEEGIRIKEEMLGWLNEKYDVTLVEVDPPNDIEFELPFIKKACAVAIESNEPVLYLHTKGAAMQNNAQQLVRDFWRYEFTQADEALFKLVDTDKPTVSAPYTLGKKICWFNAWVINPTAAKIVLIYLKLQKDRYWFERQLFQNDEIAVTGIHDNIVEWEDPWQEFLHLYSLMKQGKLFKIII